MKVRPVRVTMAERFMLVPVRMPECGGLTGMSVIVMTVIVTVHVDMLHFLMLMMMRVLIAHQKVNCQPHNATCNQLSECQCFMQEDRRKHDAEERCRGKDHLRASGAQLLRRRNVQGQTEPVCKRTDQKCLPDGNDGENMWLEKSIRE